MAKRRKSKYFFKKLTRVQNASIVGNTSVLIKSIKVSPSGTDTIFQIDNSQNSTSKYPVLIKAYRMTIATNFVGMVFQSIGDNDDFTSGDMYDWAANDPDFNAMLKRQRLTAGGDSTGVGAAEPPSSGLTAADNWHRTSLSHRGKWIKLRTPGSPDGQTICWGIHNLTSRY